MTEQRSTRCQGFACGALPETDEAKNASASQIARFNSIAPSQNTECPAAAYGLRGKARRPVGACRPFLRIFGIDRNELFLPDSIVQTHRRSQDIGTWTRTNCDQ